jgi:hypothetical protein
MKQMRNPRLSKRGRFAPPGARTGLACIGLLLLLMQFPPAASDAGATSAAPSGHLVYRATPYTGDVTSHGRTITRIGCGSSVQIPRKLSMNGTLGTIALKAIAGVAACGKSPWYAGYNTSDRFKFFNLTFKNSRSAPTNWSDLWSVNVTVSLDVHQNGTSNGNLHASVSLLLSSTLRAYRGGKPGSAIPFSTPALALSESITNGTVTNVTSTMARGGSQPTWLSNGTYEFSAWMTAIVRVYTTGPVSPGSYATASLDLAGAGMGLTLKYIAMG